MAISILTRAVIVPALTGTLLSLASCSGGQMSPAGQAPAQLPQTQELAQPPAQQTAQSPARQTQPSKTQTAPPPSALVKIVFDMGQAAGPGLDVYRGDFKPPMMQVAVGASVVWEHAEDFLKETHTVTSPEGLFDKALNFGESFTYTFTKAGVYKYYCKTSNIMTGEIYVQ